MSNPTGDTQSFEQYVRDNRSTKVEVMGVDVQLVTFEESQLLAAHTADLRAELEAWYEMWEASEYAPKIRTAAKKNMQTRIAALTNPQEGR